ncbi:MAG TPA: PAS domain S-box protein, partial [Gaiellaceae bacterium]|nr:PAS domain S-box protein [Gaiellaceae bacterium]
MTPSAPAAARPPRLVLRFAIYSAIALALAWLAIFWVVRSEAEQRAQERTAAHAAEEAARIAPSLRASDFKGPVPAARRAELDAIVAAELATGLIRMKLWSPAGVVTYSDDKSLIGDRAEDPAEIERVLAGQTVQEVTTLNQEGGSGEDLKAVESYAPVLVGDPPAPVGVLEVYEPYAPIAQEVRETVTPIAVALALALVLLYAALFPILRQVTKALDSRHKRLEEHASVLAQALDERRKAEHRLSQAERNYRDLVEQLPLVTYVDRLDETSSSIYISPQIENLLGYPPLVWLSDPEFFVKVLHPEDRERTLAAHRRAYETGESFSIKYRMQAKDGRIVWIHDEVTISKDERGRPTHAQGFLVDVSEQREAQSELERRHAELGALHETALLLIDELDARKLLERIAVRAGELVGTDDTYVYLREDDELRVAVGTGVFARNVGHTLRRGEGLAGRVWETSSPLTVDDYQSWEGRHSRYDGIPFHGVVGVPLRSRTDVVGVLGVAHVEPGKPFSEDEVKVLERFAHLVSLALENARLYTAAQEELAERRRAEEAVLQAELRYRTLVENLPLVTYISPVDSLTGNVYVSPQVEALLGYPAEEWVRNPDLLAETVHPDDWARVKADAERVRTTGESMRSEYRYVAADGRVVWALDETILVRDEEGTPLWVQGFILDITERKVAEESRARLAAIVESSDDAIMSCDLDLRWTSWNSGAQRMFGYAAEEVLGHRITLLVPDEREDETLSLLREVVSEGKVAHLETVRVRGDGARVDVAFTYSPIRDVSGRVVGVSAIGQDVTERIQAQQDRERLLAAEREARALAEAAQQDLAAQNERLRELDRLKDEFIALVSHELRTPLTSIRGYTELLLDEEAGELSADQRQFLGVVERNAHRLLHLVGDLLFLAQVEAGKLVLDVGALDLASVASESVEAARPQAEVKNITLTLATSPLPLIGGDRARIGQLLDNLVSNAVKFTPEGGRVDVRVRTEKREAVLEVRDSGMGIPADERHLLFQRFFRTSTATEQAIQGTGLGLAISKA